MCRPSVPLVCVVVVLLCCVSSGSCDIPSTTRANPISFQYVTINIIDTHAATNTTTYPTLNGTVINLAENNFCSNSVFAAACNSSADNSNLLLKAVASGMGHETNISVLDIFRCLSIWGPSLCTYDDGYTSVTYNKNQSDMKPDTYTVHILTNYFGCPCSMVKPGNGSTTPVVNSINLSQQMDTITVLFSQPIALSKSIPSNTNVPLNTLLTPDGITRLGTGAIARWKDNMTLVFTVGSKPALTSDLGLLPNIFALFNYPDYFVKSYPPISTADGLGVRFALTPQDEQVPQVFCNNVTFNIAGLWSGKQQDVAVTIQSMNGTTSATTPYYVLTRVGNTTQWKLVIYTAGLPYGSYRLNVTVPSITGGASYSKAIDLWAAGSCKCGQSPPYSECVVCSTNADCLNGGKCPPPTTNVTNKCICSNFYSGAICQIPPPCGTNSTDQSTCNNRGVCTNQDGGFQCACSDPVAWIGSRCETVSPTYVYVTLRVLRDFNTILNLTQFKFNFTRDLATILKIDPNLIMINNVYAGSTMVDMSFAPDTNNSVPASVIYSRFQNQYSNSNSSLFSTLALDPSYTPKPVYGCSASGCPSQPTSASSSTDDWKLGVGLGVGLGGGLLLLTLVCCCCCRGRHAGTAKDFDSPATTATTTTSPAQPPSTNQDVMMVPVKQDEPVKGGTHEEYKEQETGGDGRKRTVMFHE